MRLTQMNKISIKEMIVTPKTQKKHRRLDNQKAKNRMSVLSTIRITKTRTGASIVGKKISDQ
jgi:hypothetical protein